MPTASSESMRSLSMLCSGRSSVRRATSPSMRKRMYLNSSGLGGTAPTFPVTATREVLGEDVCMESSECRECARNNRTLKLWRCAEGFRRRCRTRKPLSRRFVMRNRGGGHHEFVRAELHSFDLNGDAHAARDAQCREAFFVFCGIFVAAHFVKQRVHDACASAGDGMTESDCAAIGIQALARKMQIAIAGENLRGEGFVQFDGRVVVEIRSGA